MAKSTRVNVAFTVAFDDEGQKSVFLLLTELKLIERKSGHVVLDHQWSQEEPFMIRAGFEPRPVTCRIGFSFIVEGLQPGVYDLTALFHGRLGLRPVRYSSAWTVGDLNVEVHFSTGYYYSIGKTRYRVQPHWNSLMLSVRGGNAAQSTRAVLAASLARLYPSVRVEQLPSVMRGGDGLDHNSEMKRYPDEGFFIATFPHPLSPDSSRIIMSTLGDRLKELGVTLLPALLAHRQGVTAVGLTDRLVVSFKMPVDKNNLAELLDLYQLEIQDQIESCGNVYVLRSLTGLSYNLLDIASELQGDSRVEYAEPDLLYQLHTDAYLPNDPLWKSQLDLHSIGCGEAWELLGHLAPDLKGGSPSVTIAVLDPEGVDPSHPELRGCPRSLTFSQLCI